MAAGGGYIGGDRGYPDRELGAAYDEGMQRKSFDPLGMKSTTFDMARALRGDHASPHGDDIDGKQSLGNIAFDYSVMPNRPAGGVWTSRHDLIGYVQSELAQGKRPDGMQLVSAENLLARRQPQIATGEDTTYGMGLSVDRTYAIPVVHHGGSMAGYKSDIMFFPDSGIGAAILTNSDNGGNILPPFLRRLLGITFDGKPYAIAAVDTPATPPK